MASLLEETVGGIEQVGADGAAPVAACVSVVMPAFDEGPHVAGQIRAVRAVLETSGWPFELIVVDDGSTDDTAERAAAEGARVLRHPHNLGYGAALKRGIGAARYPWILLIDVDGTYPSAAIPELLAQATEHAMVVGARTGAEVRTPWLRRPAKWLLRRLASYLVRQKIPDLNSGLRLLRKDLFERYAPLLPAGFSFTTTITLAALCNGHPVAFVPIDYHARLGLSKLRPWHAFDFLVLILRTLVFFNPLRVFGPLGGLLMGAGTVKLAFDVSRGNVSDGAVLALLGALILWAIGLLADQIAHVWKAR